MGRLPAPEGPQPPPPAPVGGERTPPPGQGTKGPERRKASLRIEKDKKAPAVELEAFKKSKDFALGDEFLREHFSEDAVAEHLQPLTKKPHELPEDFAARRQRQILSEIDERLSEPTAYAPDDWIRNILDTNAHIPPRQLSKVIEAKLLTLDVEERARAEGTVREMFSGSPQSKVLTEVGELEAYDQAEAPYMSYYGEGKEMAPEAKLDQVAFRLFEDTLADVVDPTLAVYFIDEQRFPGVHRLITDITNELTTAGEPASYRNIRRELSERFRGAGTKEERFLLRETFWAVRGRQYENMKIALEQVQRNVIGAPKGRATLHGNFLNPTAEQMATILSEIDTSKGGLEQLINDYEGFANTETGKTHEREDIRANLDNLVTNPFDLALKWQERMERSLVEPFKPKEPPMVTGRRFKEGPQGEEREGEGGEPGKRKIGEPTEKPEKEKIGEPPGVEEPKPPPPAPTEGEEKPLPTLQTEFTVHIASGKQRVEHERGEGVEVFEATLRKMAADRLTEDREKWARRFPSLSRFIERLWKGHIVEVASYGKEKGHAAALLAESGLRMIVPRSEFLRDLDTLARNNIAARRAGFGRITGALRDFASELTAKERDLHRERVVIMRQLRQAADNPNDPNAQQFIQNNQQLVSQFRELVRKDYEASEGMARRLVDTSGNDLIHTVVGERKAGQAIDLTNPNNPVGTFLKNEVMQPLLADGLANGAIRDEVLFATRRKMQEFFFSKTFVAWYDQQTPEIRQNLALSLTYGADLIPLIQETILPQLLAMQAHTQASINLDDYINKVVLQTQVGTLEAGEATIIGEGRMERAASRAVTNQRVLELYQNLRAQGATDYLTPEPHLNAALARADALGNLARIGTHQALLGIGAGVGIYGLQRLGVVGGNIIAPVVGGSIVSGVFRGMQENRLFTREQQQHEAETELGYHFALDARRRQQMERAVQFKRTMEADLRAPMEQILGEIAGGTVTQERLTELFGRIADVRARFHLRDAEAIALMSASDPSSYAVERTNLELTATRARGQLQTYLENNQAVLTAVEAQLGTTPPAGQAIPDRVNGIIDQLRNVQINHLRTGAALSPQEATALGLLTVQQAETIEARNRATQALRRQRIAVEVAKTAFVAPVTFVGLDFAADHALSAIQQGLATPLGQQISGAARNVPGASWVGERVSSVGAVVHGVGERLGMVRQGVFTRESGRALFQNPGNVPVSEDLTMAADFKTHAERVIYPGGAEVPAGTPHPGWPDVRDDIRAITFKDAAGKTIDTSPFFLRDDGALISYGEPKDFANLDQRVQNFLLEWQRNNLGPSTENNWFNIKDDLKDIIQNRSDLVGFVQWHHMMVETQPTAAFDQNLLNNLDPGLRQQITGPVRLLDLTYRPEEAVGSANRWTVHALGFVGTDGNPHIVVPSTLLGNEHFTPAQLTEVFGELSKDVWHGHEVMAGVEDFIPSNATVYTPVSEIDIPGIPIILPRRPLEAPERPGEEHGPKKPGEQPTGEPAKEGARTPPQHPPLTQTQEARRKELERRRNEGKDFSDEDQEELERLTALAKTAEEEKRKQEQEGEQPLQEPGPTPLAQRFEAIQGPVVRDGNRFFIENPAQRIDIPDGELTAYESLLPFFVNIRGGNMPTNKNVVPWAWELGEPNELAPNAIGAPRFVNGEKSTNNDSGLLALAAASSETETNQAQLYRALTDAILRVHEGNPQLLLLKGWLVHQFQREQGNDASSLEIFAAFDTVDPQRRNAPLRPENEILLPRNATDQIDITAAAVTAFWEPRLQELRTAFTGDQLTTDHLRWIEFLSHSVDVPKLIELAKEQQNTPPSTPPAGEKRGTPTTENLEATAATVAQLNTDVLNGVIEKGGLGGAVEFSPEELSEMHRLVDVTQSIRDRLVKEQRAQWGHFEGFLDRRRKESGRSDEEKYIIADPQRVTVYWGSYQDGKPVIMVPPAIRKLYDTGIALETVERNIRAYEAETARAGSTQELSDALEKVLKFAQENQEGKTDFQKALRSRAEEFTQLDKGGEAEVSHLFPTGDGGKFIWQEVTFGQTLTKGSDDRFRGYVMVEPGDIAHVLEMLTRLGQERMAAGKTTDFKWLAMVTPPLLDTVQWAQFLNNPDNIGRYEDLHETDPRIVLYSDTLEDVKEVLAQLARNADWQEIESNRINASGGIEHTPRRPGTNSFVDGNNREWRSLNFNNKPGYSENEAADPDWRSQKEGTPTIQA